jgi:hypothetical protein
VVLQSADVILKPLVRGRCRVHGQAPCSARWCAGRRLVDDARALRYLVADINTTADSTPCDPCAGGHHVLDARRAGPAPGHGYTCLAMAALDVVKSVVGTCRLGAELVGDHGPRRTMCHSLRAATHQPHPRQKSPYPSGLLRRCRLASGERALRSAESVSPGGAVPGGWSASPRAASAAIMVGGSAASALARLVAAVTSSRG